MKDTTSILTDKRYLPFLGALVFVLIVGFMVGFMVGNGKNDAAMPTKITLTQAEMEKHCVMNLMQAAYSENIAAMNCLLQLNIDLNARDKYGNGILYHALNDDNIAPLKLLLEAGADVNAQNENGDTALRYAAFFGYVAATATLLAHPDIQVDTRNEYGDTPLVMAAFASDKEDAARITNLLLNAGANINAKNENGDNVLMRTLKSWLVRDDVAEEVVKILLANPKLELMAKNKEGQTALEIAYQKSKTKIAAMIEAAMIQGEPI